MAEKTDRSDNRPGFSVKRCPYCSTYLGLEVIKCDDCGRRVGPADANGIAKKPVDWKAYVTAAIMVGVFVYFIYRYL
jgi:hypothetical protein